MTKTFTLEKTTPATGGTHTDIVEFAIDETNHKAIVAKACSWNRVVNGEQDNGSDLFGQKPATIVSARHQYRQYLNLGYVRTNANYFLVEA
jgi:hypothetical protein